MLKAIVLAAGKGTRLHSEEKQLPKVLQPLNNRALVEYVLDALNFIGKPDITLVVGFLKEQVQALLGDDYKYAVQEQQLGTGHAVASAHDILENYEGNLLICYGDMPLIKQKTLTDLVRHHQETSADCTLLVGKTELSLPYGRILRNNNGDFHSVLEEKDCNDAQKAIQELNIGVYVVRCPLAFEALKQLSNDNASQEYYLTDLPGILASCGFVVETWTLANLGEARGINTSEDLLYCEKWIESESTQPNQ